MPLKEKSKRLSVAAMCVRWAEFGLVGGVRLLGAGFDLAEGEGDGAGVAVGGEGVDPGASGVAEAEEFGYFVEGFAGGVVYGAAYVLVVSRLLRCPALGLADRGGCGLRRLRGRGGVNPP